MIYFVKDLRSSFFEWLQESKDTVIRIILKNINEQTENSCNYMETPILEQESQISEKIIKSFLIPTFVLCTKGLSELQQSKIDVKDENRELKKIIKLNEMEKITSATKEGLDNMNLNKIDKKFIEILNKRDSKLEAKLTKLLSEANTNQTPKLNRKSKNLYDSHQKGRAGKAISNSKYTGVVKNTHFKKMNTKTNDYQSTPHLEWQNGKQLQKTIPTKKTNKSAKTPQQKEKKGRSRRYEQRHKKRQE